MECIVSNLMVMGVSSKIRTNKDTGEETTYRQVSVYMPENPEDDYSQDDLKKINIPDTPEGRQLFSFLKSQKMKEVALLCDYKPGFEYEKNGKTNRIDERFQIKAVIDTSSIKTIDYAKVKAA